MKHYPAFCTHERQSNQTTPVTRRTHLKKGCCLMNIKVVTDEQVPLVSFLGLSGVSGVGGGVCLLDADSDSASRRGHPGAGLREGGDAALVFSSNPLSPWSEFPSLRG